MLMRLPLARDRRRPSGFIRPAQPILAEQPPIGPDWLYGVKHDGFRIVARKSPEGLHLWSRNGRDWVGRVRRHRHSSERLEAPELRDRRRGLRLRRRGLA